jgi:hypothetical protein
VPLDRDFIESLRISTEAAWREHQPRRVMPGDAGGLDWQSGTRWRGGMSDAEIEAAETTYGLVFPPDYRLFLSTLHTPDPQMVGAFYRGSGLVAAVGREIPDWTGDRTAIDDFLNWPLEGLVWSLEAEALWHEKWGPRPRGRRQREHRVRTLAAEGAQLVPVLGHRYLAGPGDRPDNPVISIYGIDTIVYAPTLRDYLPMDLPASSQTRDAIGWQDSVAPIPFWQDVIDWIS